MSKIKDYYFDEICTGLESREIQENKILDVDSDYKGQVPTEVLEFLDKTKISDIVVEDIDILDAPDFSDAYITSANYENKPLNDKQLDELNEDDDFRYESIIKFITSVSSFSTKI